MFRNPLLTRLTQVMLGLALLSTTYLAITPVDYPVLSDINDKLQHVFAFLVLAFLADQAFPQRAWNWRKFILLLAYGLALEIIQYFVPGRFFSLLDLAADALGLLLYGLSLPLWRRAHLRQDHEH